MDIIAHIYTDFPTKFGIPRQSGLVESLEAKIVFEKEYRNAEALRGLSEYSHIWLLWQFSESIKEKWSPTVRPPRLGGNKRVGVFATRSPYRPNPIGLSSVKLKRIEISQELGPVIFVEGADILNGTPIYDIKPYLPFTDSHPEAVGGFSDRVKQYSLDVSFPSELLSLLPCEKHKALKELLAQDPRPSYQDDSDRLYGLNFADFEIKFSVSQNTLYVKSVEKIKPVCR